MVGSREQTAPEVESTGFLHGQGATAADRLNNVGLRATGPRLSVLAFFNEMGQQHATADEVYWRMVEKGQEVSLGTLYRVLSNLTEVGLLVRSFFDAGVAVYELRPAQPHDHLVCLACGKIDDFVDPVIDERRRAIARSTGFATAYHQLALYGYCPTCRLAKVDGKVLAHPGIHRAS